MSLSSIVVVVLCVVTLSLFLYIIALVVSIRKPKIGMIHNVRITYRGIGHEPVTLITVIDGEGSIYDLGLLGHEYDDLVLNKKIKFWRSGGRIAQSTTHEVLSTSDGVKSVRTGTREYMNLLSYKILE